MQCFNSAPYSHDEVAQSILLAPSKEQAHLATVLMTDGRCHKLFPPKGRDPWLSDLWTELWVSGGGVVTPSLGRVDDVTVYDPLLLDSV